MTSPGLRWLYLAAGMLASLAIVLAGYLLLRQKPPPVDPPPVSESASAPAADKPTDAAGKNKTSKLELVVKGGPGLLFVDGKRVGKLSQKSLTLDPGKHVIEVRGKGKRLKRVVLVKDGESTELIADIKKGRFLDE